MFSLDNIALVERVPPRKLLQTQLCKLPPRSQLAAWLFAYASGLPLLTVLIWAVIFKPGGHKLHVTILGLAISLILTSFLTDIVKNSVGRPRPDLIARCKPRDDTPKHSLVTIDVCTETHHHRLHDGWRSFPSGHSSFAFSGLGYLALYVYDLAVCPHTRKSNCA